MPASQKKRGRWLYLVNGESPTFVQNVHAEPGELREWVEARRCPMSHPATSAQVSGQVGHPSGTPETVEWVRGLDAAAERAGMATETFRKRRQRAGGALPGEQRDGNVPAFPSATLDALRVSREPADRRGG